MMKSFIWVFVLPLAFLFSSPSFAYTETREIIPAEYFKVFATKDGLASVEAQLASSDQTVQQVFAELPFKKTGTSDVVYGLVVFKLNSDSTLSISSGKSDVIGKVDTQGNLTQDGPIEIVVVKITMKPTWAEWLKFGLKTQSHYGFMVYSKRK